MIKQFCRVVSVVAFLLPVAACSSKSSPSGSEAEPAGQHMCSFMSTQRLTALVGPLAEISPGDGSIHDSCLWRVRGTEVLNSNSGSILWDTTKTLANDTADARSAYTPVTVHGHPGLLGQTHTLTLVAISTSDSPATAGEVLVSLQNGTAEGKTTALALGDAALRYVEAHQPPE